MSESRFCRRSDRHNPKMVCGYPLPCPHHTLVVEEVAPAVVSVGKLDGSVLTEDEIAAGLRAAAAVFATGESGKKGKKK